MLDVHTTVKIFSRPKKEGEMYKKAVLSQGNRAMQHVFPTPDDSLIVICFSLRKVKAVIAPALRQSFVD